MDKIYSLDARELRILELASTLLTDLMAKNPEHVKSEVSTSFSITIQDFQHIYHCSEATIRRRLRSGEIISPQTSFLKKGYRWSEQEFRRFTNGPHCGEAIGAKLENLILEKNRDRLQRIDDDLYADFIHQIDQIRG